MLMLDIAKPHSQRASELLAVQSQAWIVERIYREKRQFIMNFLDKIHAFLHALHIYPLMTVHMYGPWPNEPNRKNYTALKCSRCEYWRWLNA